MARASIPTLLSLDRYAKILGVNPVHFNSGIGTTSFPVTTNSCSDLWPQHSWQFLDHVSREDLARAINDAEEEIARLMGYYPAPKYICQEVKSWPRFHRRDLWRRGGRDVRSARASVTTRYGKFIAAGQRTVSLVGTATVVGGTLTYNTAAQTLTATIALTTTLTDECEIHVFFNGHSAAPEWEIRPLTSVTISGGTVTIVAPLWLFIDPDLWEVYPTVAEFSAIDITDTDNLVASVDVYRVYTDATASSATFYWEPEPQGIDTLSFCCTSCGGSGCPACELTSQDGCLHVRNSEIGEVVPVPATYNSTTGQWDQDAFVECRDPDQVKIYYLAGDYDNRWLCGNSCDPLSDYWAQTIAYLATARLDRSPCQCGTVQKMFDRLREDIALVGERSRQVDPALLSNPLGTRWGEVTAWQRLKINGRRIAGGAI